MILHNILGYLKTLEKPTEEQLKLLNKIKFEVDTLIETAEQERLLREQLEVEVWEMYKDEISQEEIDDLIDGKSNDELAELLGYKNELDYIQKNIKYFNKLIRRA